MKQSAIIQADPAPAEPTGVWRDPDALLARLGTDPGALAPPASADNDFPMRLTATLAARIRPGAADDPILRQFLPTQAERQVGDHERHDPVGDHAALHAHGIIQKYRGRALVMLTGACAVHCRYCFRRHMDYADHATGHNADAALHALRADTTLREVILSGGDPLSLSPARLCAFIDGLAGIAHVRTIRLHSRTIVADPARVTPAIINALRAAGRRVVVVTHVNHANELGADAAAALGRLHAAGFQLLNQAVLLRGVNDSVDAQIALSEALFDLGVLPYYLHALDPVAGAGHFAVDDNRGLEIVKGVRAKLPGYLVPQFVREHAGDPAKRPVGEPAPALTV